MKGMGKYTAVEMELSHLSSDEMNELYLSGDLDKAYEDYDRTGEVKPLNTNTTKKRKRKARKG
jgi:hypothetical protein